MYVLIYCRDKAGALDLRMANREAHLAYVAEHIDKVKVAGPLFADDGTTMVGSMLLMEAGSVAEIEAWSEADPYRKAGLFEEVKINQINWSFGAPE